MLFIGCCAGSDTPAVWVWKRISQVRWFFAPKRSLHHLAPDLAGGAIFGDLLEEIVVRVEEEAESRAEIVDIESAPLRPLHVLDAVVQGERQFLQRGRTGLANVIAADRNGVEARREFRSELEGVDHQPHRRRRRIDIFLLRDVFLQNVVLDRAGNLFPVRALLFGDHQIHGPQAPTPAN